MSLTLSLDDLARFQLLVGLSPDDGSCTFSIKSQQQRHVPPQLVGLGISINFHTVSTDNGTCLAVSTTFPSTSTTSQQDHSDSSPQPSSSNTYACEVGVASDMGMPEGQVWPAEWTKLGAVDDFAAACAGNAPSSLDGSYFDITNLANMQYTGADFTSVPEKTQEPEPVESVLTSPLSSLGPSSSSSSSSYPNSLSDLSEQLLSPTTTVSSRYSPPLGPQFDDFANYSAASCPPTSPEPTESEGTAQTLGKTQRVRRHPCLHPGCTRKFTSEYTRRVHMEAHKPKVRKCVPCTMEGCKEVFSRRHDRLRHEVSQHGKVCEWLCKECSRFFSSQRRLENHKCRGSINAVSRWPILPQNNIAPPSQNNVPPQNNAQGVRAG
ncbi:hypothetical protein GLOTRDRAFT_95705 [Gloeophyllum trabeum ATCC 11539]|uniref:C2H2-type domain-containing protein n=1 Tax=Gloeophyllum trabeum (strain ATCC 11539 / FP-39264 / Madison 617) TaxID=670483 RepID=S7PXJ3_GLOTA|nr:uncharacterized protein GLOTRDRAFT_95705 [Gloeophyllum trabeum ATCC 11539]EPQ52007.1 hypothetical protein GLOTRDRAFT_95705 [Gloeophyllum trabeum ATCC 11539]